MRHSTDLRTFAEMEDMPNEDFLSRKLEERRAQDALRRLRLPEAKVDFCSNDYLGVVRNGLIGEEMGHGDAHGSGGSRLLTGNYLLIEETEKTIAAFHAAPSGLIYNSGYDANVGLLSSVPRRGDIVLYDALSHASIRDGIRLSFAQAYGFSHNDCAELERRLTDLRGGTANVFVVTESVFSMDGDLAPLEEIATICRRYGAHLIVDEAHATGVMGPSGVGLVQEKGLQDRCFARIHTFGKAMGCHGAIVLGSGTLRDYLINFSRAFIYTTALPPVSVRAMATAYRLMPSLQDERMQLERLIDWFRAATIGFERLESSTPIQGVIVPGNATVKVVADRLQAAGLDVRPILYPTVPRGRERLRIVLHAFNTQEEVRRLTALLQNE
jgi:8-amino-7-oxononanoate synthase